MVIKSILAIFCTLGCISCGGGGSGGSPAPLVGVDSNATTSVGTSEASNQDASETTNNVGIVFNSINLEFDITVAQLQPSRDSSSASIWQRLRLRGIEALASLSGLIFPNAIAQNSGLRVVDSSEAAEISKLFYNTELQSIENSVTITELDENGDVLLDEDGNAETATVECDLSTLELHVEEVRRLSLSENTLIARVNLPYELDQDCNARFMQRTIVINEQKSVFDVSEEFQLTPSTLLVPAANGSFNISEEAVVAFEDGILRSISFKNGALIIEQLSAETVELKTDRAGRFIYDGTKLITIQDEETLTLVTFTKGSTSFDIYRPETGFATPPLLSYLAFGSEQEELLISSGTVFYLNLEEQNITELGLDEEVEQKTDGCFDEVEGSLPLNCLYVNMLNPGQIFLGRFEDWLVDTEAALNYKTGEYTGQLGCLPNVRRYCGNAGEFVDWLDNFMFVVDDTRAKFIRFELNTRNYKLINLDDWGYLADADYYITEDSAYVNVANSENSNKEFIEIDYALESVTRLGVLTEGSRAVNSFYTPGT